MKTAILIGATGLVGDYLLQQLLLDDRFSSVKVFGRRPTGYQSPKLQEHLIDFGQPQEWSGLLTGDVLFSALGTTLKQAGSQNAQYEVDYTYQYRAAQAAAEHGVETLVLVSSAGADAHSIIFYSRMKGELEQDVKKLPFHRIRILQPGMLAGFRKEPRTGERIGLLLGSLVGQLPVLRQYRPIHGRTVAQAMINAALDETPGVQTISLEDVFTRAEGV
ncbi:NAD(P)H-binding protein [Hymenobacter taeanensis]|uniref:NAD(P)H-binding protein n=1 Tax=Hymenobacter taeanensis TaxID=2735321 RepID=A0A6M6BLA2_9BACT|nr:MULTISPECIES: NAD(P)H-binding protein [Hymenobacter]QJX48759.1 NAD(P)H-binding protein [Hymenobacter taeanensis]UOQ81735.1 NAD(P)H-binding protein [Hymenobacter sp. 5414T-23]